MPLSRRLPRAPAFWSVAVLLVLIAAALLVTHLGTVAPLDLAGPLRTAAGALTGLGIGVVAAVMGVAGGELLIPALVRDIGPRVWWPARAA